MIAHVKQANGVALKSSTPLQVPLLGTTATPVVTLDISDGPLWANEEWEAATLLGQDYLPDSRELMVEARLSKDAFLYWVQWVGHLKIEPERIQGRHWFGHLPLVLEMEMLELALSIHLAQRQVPIIHAAAVELNGKAICLMAESGGGKSSLTAALVQSGAGFLNDDITALWGDEFQVFPGHSLMRLNQDSASAMLAEDLYSRLYPHRAESKMVTDVRQWGRVHPKPCPLSAVYLVEATTETEQVTINPLRGYRGLYQMMSASVGQAGWSIVRRGEQLRLWSRLMESIPIKHIVYPRRYKQLPEVVAALLNDLGDW